MSATGYYDTELQMFTEDHLIDYNRLKFIRWLIEHDRLHTRRVDDAAEEVSHEHTVRPLHVPV